MTLQGTEVEAKVEHATGAVERRNTQRQAGEVDRREKNVFMMLYARKAGTHKMPRRENVKVVIIEVNSVIR